MKIFFLVSLFTLTYSMNISNAEPELYGSLLYEHHLKDFQQYNKNRANRRKLEQSNTAGSFVGIRGSHNLGNNKRLIYNIEQDLLYSEPSPKKSIYPRKWR